MKKQITDTIMQWARIEKRKINQRGHEFQPGYGQPLGYYVETVFTWATNGLSLPVGIDLSQCDDAKTIRTILNNLDM
jgi:hypothetical protein